MGGWLTSISCCPRQGCISSTKPLSGCISTYWSFPLVVPGTRLEQVKNAMSHTVLLGQCRDFLGKHKIHRITGADTAGSAQHVAEENDPALAALASELAGEIYGLDVLARHIEDHDKNTTRFLVMSRDMNLKRRGDGAMMMAFVFRVRNIPAALYKALGGFATNGVNMTKLESYMVDGSFSATQFYAEIEGHPDDKSVQLAMDELEYFTDHISLLGVYPADEKHR